MRPIPRRTFLRQASTGLAAVALARPAARAARDEPRRKKAIKIGMAPGDLPLKERFQLIKDCGFDGVDMDAPGGPPAAEVRAAADASGLIVHGCVNSAHWKDTLSHPDPAVQERGVAALRQALEDCKAYGGTTVLLVPAVVNAEVTYDEAYTRSQANIRKVLPDAQRLGLTIALENVWNNFLLSPLETARYIDEFQSPHVGAYFDVGNVLRYGWPEHWIRTLAHRIVKVDVKEFSVEKMNEQGLWKGFDAPLGEGSVNWPAVTRALDDIGFHGFCTAELAGGDAAYLRDLAARMDRCLGIG